MLGLDSLPGAKVAKNAGGIPSNVQELFETNRDSFSIAVDGFETLLLTLVIDYEARRKMSEAAVAYAATRTWGEAMKCLMDGELFCLEVLLFADLHYVNIGYQEAASITRQKRAEKLFSALSRTSSTVSLLDVKIEEPPMEMDLDEKDNEVSGTSSARLLFGRPPIKKLLRRSARTALRESISHRFKRSLRRDYTIVGRSHPGHSSKRQRYFSELCIVPVPICCEQG